MLDLRSVVYSMGPVGLAFELYETREYNPNPVGIAGWLVANSAATYGATYALTGSGQTAVSVYGPVVAEEVANLGRIIRGPKSPPGPLSALAVGGVLLHVTLPSIQNLFGIDQIEYA